MKRVRALQVALILVGLFYFSWIYFLFATLWHSRWLDGYHESFPMFLSLNITLGAFLLLSVKHPARHRTLIAYGGWSSLAHAFAMAIQTEEAWAHGIHRNPWDVPLIGGIGVVLLVLLPRKQSESATAKQAESVAPR
jgi:Family of unknown function (DUF6632)